MQHFIGVNDLVLMSELVSKEGLSLMPGGERGVACAVRIMYDIFSALKRVHSDWRLLLNRVVVSGMLYYLHQCLINNNMALFRR